MDQTKILKFLTLARKAIEYKESTVENNVSNQGTFVQGNLSYSDSSKGFELFSGKETIIHNGKVVWKRFYKGRITDNFLSKEEIREVLSFLKIALTHFPDSHPEKRGPELYEKEMFEYTTICTGNFEKFKGTEKITKNGKTVYELSYYS